MPLLQGQSVYPLITIIRDECPCLPKAHQITILATGPLTSELLAEDIKEFTGEKECHFFDAASPIITGESIDFSTAFRASRYDKGDADYVNCPMNEESYLKFHSALIKACLLYTSPSPRDISGSRMPSSA